MRARLQPAQAAAPPNDGGAAEGAVPHAWSALPERATSIRVRPASPTG